MSRHAGPRKNVMDPDERARLGREYSKRYDQGETLEEIAASVGRVRDTVRRYMVESGWEPLVPGERIKPRAKVGGDLRASLAEVVKELYENGASTREVAVHVGRSRQTVVTLLREAGGTPRRRGPRLSSEVADSPLETEKGADSSVSKRITGDLRVKMTEAIILKYQAGMSIKGIAKCLGRSYGFVRARLLEAKVPLRSRGSLPPRTTRPRSELATKAREAYEGDMSLKKLGTALGVSHYTARKLVIEAGGTIRTPSGA